MWRQVFDTYITIVGNVLHAPEWRRLERGNTLVTRFRVAANSRRYDRELGRWVDGASLRVRVSCWRRLAENVAQSVLGGDPVIVTGRIYTRDWIGEDGQRRITYELDATAVGHDLARGTDVFTRQRAAMGLAVSDETFGGPGWEEAPSSESPPGPVGIPDTLGPEPDERASLVGASDSGPPEPDDPTAHDDALRVLRSAGLEPVGPQGEV